MLNEGGGTITLAAPFITPSPSNSLTLGGVGTLDVRARMEVNSQLDTASNFATEAWQRRGTTVRVSGPDGQLTGGTFVARLGGSLIGDDREGYRADRLAGSTVSLSHGGLTVHGNASIDTVQSIGTLSAWSGSVVTLRPEPGRNLRVNVGTISAGGLIRGANLGAVPGPGVTNLFITNAPPPEGTILARTVGDDTADGPGRSFVTHSPTTGLRLLRDDEYAPMPMSGGGSGPTSSSSATIAIASSKVNSTGPRVSASYEHGTPETLSVSMSR